MTDETYDDQERPFAVPAPELVQPSSGTLVKALDQSEIDRLLAPYTVDMRTWLNALFGRDEMPEADPDDMALGMMAQILMAKTSEEALTAFTLDRAKEMCGNEPGGKSAVLSIRGARPLKSDYEEGARCYVVVDAVRKVDGELARFTTGAHAVQTVIFKHMWEGWMPFDAMLEIRKERTKRGFYPLNLVSGI